MPYIFVWKPKYGHIGHVSLRVSSEIYISFWPVDQYGHILFILDVNANSKGLTYEEDCVSEGSEDNQGKAVPRPPDVEIEVQGNLNNEEIKKWWEKYKHCGYSRTKNCCNAVKLALRIGELPQKELLDLENKVNQWETSFTDSWLSSFGGKSRKQ